MATIQITDKLGVNIAAQLAPTSTLLQAAAALPKMILSGANIQQLQILTLADPAVTALSPGLSFAEPVSLAGGALALKLTAAANASFAIIGLTPTRTALFAPDDYGDPISIAAKTCYVAVGFNINADAAVTTANGAMSFGFDASSMIECQSYRLFSAGVNAPVITEALRQSIGGFVIPTSAADLGSLPDGSIVTVTGRGCLKFSGSANLLTVANPLASLALPSPLPGLAVVQTGSFTVGASWQITGEFQVRTRKLDARRIRLGWYRKHNSDFAVTASASAGINAGTSTTDLFSALIGAVSSDAKADLDELSKAGLKGHQADQIQAAVKAAVDRRLQLAAQATFDLLSGDEAAFLYDVDLNALNAVGESAVSAALKGDFSALADPDTLPTGIVEVHSILTKTRGTQLTLRVNLLGIFNYGYVSKLAMSGVVTYTPTTGELVIADTESASRIGTTAVNFGADEDKLRRLMAESLLITAAYRGSRTALAAPTLASSHVFFRLDASISNDNARRFALIAGALGFDPPPVPSGVRTFVRAEAAYDDGLMRALFLQPDGSPRARSDYEQAGRDAVALLVPPDGDDAIRRLPATNDDLWNWMTEQGPPSFHQRLPAPQDAQVTPDYLDIEWWADAMYGAGAILAEFDAFFKANAHPSPDDVKFQSLRQKLSAHMGDVTSKTREQFGAPWGLLAMYLVSGKRAQTSVEISAPRFTYARTTALPAGV